MARSAIEHDFFSKKKESNGLPPAVKSHKIERRRSFRDIQGVISKMNPEVVKSVIENGSLGGNKRKPAVSSPKETQTNISPFPVCDPTLRLGCGHNGKNDEKNAPMTIFYNGIVAVFDVSPNQAQGILKVAEERLPESAELSESNPYNQENLLDGDFPMKRTKSLQVFLKKRKESRGRNSS
ncbi:hypothetical protein CDL12_27590 [Handroanthus impetiginosus]|uniref:Protein TIFY n=1 Tax=Handroanthus impetiginosus TaxID=429701 RepID=A0A2G9G4S1_9LAMI|nr:hypothetical protein CDL12_27590 [Handroanthus impetiginosus]